MKTRSLQAANEKKNIGASHTDTADGWQAEFRRPKPATKPCAAVVAVEMSTMAGAACLEREVRDVKRRVKNGSRHALMAIAG